MATIQLAFLVVAVLLLQASRFALSQQDATMVWTTFEGKDGDSGPAACDGKYHFDGAPIAALSTQWYADGSRCWKGIYITSKDTGKTVRVSVVDEVDGGSMIATIALVWKLLGYDYPDKGEVAVTWADE